MTRDTQFANPHEPQSWNLYAYGLNSPTNRTDPSGRESERAGITPQCVSFIFAFAAFALGILLFLLFPELGPSSGLVASTLVSAVATGVLYGTGETDSADQNAAQTGALLWLKGLQGTWAGASQGAYQAPTLGLSNVTGYVATGLNAIFLAQSFAQCYASRR